MMLVNEEGINCHESYDVQTVTPHWGYTNDYYIKAGSVCPLTKCASKDAKMLRIFNLLHKLKHSNEYDIGGTYTEDAPDLWFYYTTSVCPGYNYLLNLFVCHRKIGNFTIGISDTNEVVGNNRLENTKTNILPSDWTWHTYKSAQPNETFHIKTFCFTDKSIEGLDAAFSLAIPITVAMDSSITIGNDVLISIKLQHDLCVLSLKDDNPDFIIISQTGRKFPVHKIILIAHSPVFRNLLKGVEHESVIDIQDSDMESLLQFLYTGTVKDIHKQDYMTLLKIAETYQLQDLFQVIQCGLAQQISIENAVDMVLISYKYGLDKLQSKVMSFIKKNPKVVQTKGWKELDNVELMKQLIEHIYTKWA